MKKYEKDYLGVLQMQRPARHQRAAQLLQDNNIMAREEGRGGAVAAGEKTGRGGIPLQRRGSLDGCMTQTVRQNQTRHMYRERRDREQMIAIGTSNRRL